MDAAGARIANIVLGAWLFLSAFFWQHTSAQFTNTWAMGLAIVLFALLGVSSLPFRILTALAAIWVFVSLWILPTESAATRWNNALVALFVFLFTMSPRRRPRPILPADRRVRA